MLRCSPPVDLPFPIGEGPLSSDWGVGMTLCAAAVANGGHAIVTVSDVRMTLGFTAGEGKNTKGRQIADRWSVFFAGNDVTQAPLVMDRATDTLRDLKLIDQWAVQSAMQSAIQETVQQKIEASVLSSYGMDLRAFVDKGLRKLGVAAFTEIRHRIEQVDLGSEFLVCGFADREDGDSIEHPVPHIQYFHGRGSVESYDQIGFWAIGSGAHAALSSLFFHDYNFYWPLRRSIYQMCAAKFMAERSDLGRETNVLIFLPDKRILSIDADKVREIWEREGKPKIPDDLSSMPPPLRVVESQSETTTWQDHDKSGADRKST
jgi:hypothetical protein